MTKNELSRRAMLGALASLPAVAVAGAMAGTREEFSAGLARKPQLMGFATARAEVFNAPMTTLRGRLPSGLTGVLWRNGPAEHERFGHRYTHWFDGDGMVQAFAFSGDKVTHRARVLDTPKRRRETRAGKRIMPAFATPGSEPLMGPDDMNVANTAMLVHAGRLMALWEGGSALAVDPETLDAGRFVVWRPDLAGLPFSAHPKVETDGSLWNIGFVTRPRPALLFYRIDPGGRLVKVIVLGYSRLLWLHFYTRQTMPVLMEGLESAFDRFGGVPEELLFDQMRAVVLSDDRGAGGGLVLNEEFLRFAAHWGFMPRSCRPYRAQTKGKVERPIRYIRESFFYGRSFANDNDLNEQAVRWLEGTANVRRHATTGERPVDRFERDERAVLLPLANHPYRRLGARHAPEPAPRRLPATVKVERRPLSVYTEALQ